MRRVGSRRTPGDVASRRPRSAVAVTLVVWFVSSCACAVGLLALQPVVGLDPAVLSLVMLAPALGAVPAWFMLRNAPQVWRPARVGRRRSVMNLALVTAVCASFFVAMAIVTGLDVPANVAGVPLIAFIALQGVGALCEEIGFRGVLFHGLLPWFPRWLATLAVGVLFGFWHVQYFALPLGEHLSFLVAVLLLNATMIYTMVGSFWWRMLTCTLIHLAANLTLGFSASAEASMTDFLIVILAGAVVAAVLLAISRTLLHDDRLP